MSATKHSPTPWRVESFTASPLSRNTSCLRMIAGEDREIFNTDGSDDETGPQAVADMEFSARAANAHDDLVAALEQAAKALSHDVPEMCRNGPECEVESRRFHICMGCAAMKTIREALKKAGVAR